MAASSAVLLRNDGTLPLRPGRLRTVAVVGPHAVRPRVQGGGSAEVFPERVVSPLEGLRAALPGVRVVAVPGPGVLEGPVPLDPPLARRPGTDEPGVRVRMLDAAGGELYEEHRLSGRTWSHAWSRGPTRWRWRPGWCRRRRGCGPSGSRGGAGCR